MLCPVCRPGLADMATAGADDGKGASYLDAFAAFRDEVRMKFFLTHQRIRSLPNKVPSQLDYACCLLALGGSVFAHRMQQRCN